MNRDVTELLVANGVDPAQLTGKNRSLVEFSAFAGIAMMIDYWIETLAATGRMTKEKDKEAISRAIKIAQSKRYTDIAILLEDQYERLSKE